MADRNYEVIDPSCSPTPSLLVRASGQMIYLYGFRVKENPEEGRDGVSQGGLKKRSSGGNRCLRWALENEQVFSRCVVDTGEGEVKGRSF